MKNTCFSWHRFWNLCQKEMVESWKTYVLRFVLMYGVLVIAFVINGFSVYNESRSSWYVQRGLTTDPAWDSIFHIMIIGLFIFSCISASLIMDRMKTKTSSLSVLLTPVTPFEYFFSRWIVFTAGFLAVYLVAYTLADWTRVLFFLMKAPEGMIVEPASLHHIVSVNPFGIFKDEDGASRVAGFIMGYFFLQSFFVLGSSIWPKNSFLKTFAAGILLIIVFALIGQACYALGGVRSANVEMTSEVGNLIAGLIMGGFILANWALAYYRFKESEIINRF